MNSLSRITCELKGQIRKLPIKSYRKFPRNLSPSANANPASVVDLKSPLPSKLFCTQVLLPADPQVDQLWSMNFALENFLAVKTHPTSKRSTNHTCMQSVSTSTNIRVVISVLFLRPASRASTVQGVGHLLWPKLGTQSLFKASNRMKERIHLRRKKQVFKTEMSEADWF